MKSELRFSWPDTGELSVRINGNESAALRFFPSEEAIIDGLRKNGVEAAYDDFADTHPHTPTEAKRTRYRRFLEISDGVLTSQSHFLVV
jgi:hypothetical protein